MVQVYAEFGAMIRKLKSLLQICISLSLGFTVVGVALCNDLITNNNSVFLAAFQKAITGFGDAKLIVLDLPSDAEFTDIQGNHPELKGKLITSQAFHKRYPRVIDYWEKKRAVIISLRVINLSKDDARVFAQIGLSNLGGRNFDYYLVKKKGQWKVKTVVVVGSM
jgi:hypothetical protein